MADDELPNLDIISSFRLQAPENEAENRSQKNEVADNKRRFAHMALQIILRRSKLKRQLSGL